MKIAALWRCGALAAGIALAFPALANTAEVQDLIKRGQFAKALEQTDQLLVQNPKDAQLRFLKGLALTELRRQADAVDVFQGLTADYPELPEPYNNLAVIYAQQGEYEKARAALEMAIRTHPSYATAHENLGDVYSRLASQAYNKALQLDAGNSAAQTKLSMIRELITASSAPIAVAAKPAVAGRPGAAPASTATPPTATPPIALATAAPVAAVATAPAATASAADAGLAEAITATVLDWAKAWSNKDIKAYLSFYSPDFVVPGGRSRSGWEAERRARVGKPGRISVQLEDIRVDVNGSEATVRFRQHYNSDTFDASANKSLDMVRSGEHWRIRREAIGG